MEFESKTKEFRMDEIILDNTEYDVIILGAETPAALLSSALSRNNKKVLHFDKNPMYGGNTANMNVKEMQRWIDGCKTDEQLEMLDAMKNVPTNEEIIDIISKQKQKKKEKQNNDKMKELNLKQTNDSNQENEKNQENITNENKDNHLKINENALNNESSNNDEFEEINLENMNFISIQTVTEQTGINAVFTDCEYKVILFFLFYVFT